MIKIEPLYEKENKFLENLNYQISKKYGFYQKIPAFKQNNSEGRRSENSYMIMKKELESLIQKYKDRQQGLVSI